MGDANGFQQPAVFLIHRSHFMQKNNLLLALICLLLFATGCAEQGPAEKAGEKIDETMERSMDTVDEAVGEAEDNAEAASEAIEDQIDEINGGY